MNTMYIFNTKHDTYEVKFVKFIISTNKITCVSTIYNDPNNMVGIASGIGFNCSESMMAMLDSVPKIISDFEKTIIAFEVDNVGNDSFESNTNADKYERLK